MNYLTLSKRPFLLAALFMILGSIIGALLPPFSPMMGIAICIFLWFAYFLKPRTSLQLWAVSITFLFLGATLIDNQIDEDIDVNKITQEKIFVTIEHVKPKRGGLIIEGQIISGKAPIGVLIRLTDSCDLNLTHGTLLELKAKLRVPNHERIPNGFNYKNYLGNKNIFLISYAKCSQLNIVTSTNSTFSNFCQQIQRGLMDRINRSFQDANSIGLVKGILLGYKDDMDVNERQMYSLAGVGHVFAVSGMHVGMVYLLCLPLLFFRHRNTWTKLSIPVAVLIVVWLFVIASGLTPSAMRAGMMISLYEIGNMCYRKVDKWNILAFTAVLSVFWNPNIVFDIGFQFSYLALIGIFFFYGRLNKIFSIKNPLLKFMVNMIILSISAQLTLLPLSLYYFGDFSPYFWLSSLIAMLIVQLNFVLSFIVLVIGDFHSLNYFLVDLIDRLFGFLSSTIELILMLPRATLSYEPNLSAVLIGYQIIASLVALLLFQNKLKVFIISLCSLSGLMVLPAIVNCFSNQNHLLIYREEQVQLAFSGSGRMEDLRVDNILRADEVLRIGDTGIAAYAPNRIKDDDGIDVLLIENGIPSNEQWALLTSCKHVVITSKVSWKDQNNLREMCDSLHLDLHNIYNGLVKIEL